MSPYNFFKVYQAVRLHFYTDYDMLKYNGKSNINTTEAFDDRQDRTLFVYWADKINSSECLKFCVWNSLEKEEWFYDPFDDANNLYLEKKKFFSSFTVNVENDCQTITKIRKDRGISFDSMLDKTPLGNNPPLLQIYLRKMVSLEFVCITNMAHGLVEKWADKYKNDPMITSELKKIEKYTPFLTLFK